MLRIHPSLPISALGFFLSVVAAQGDTCPIVDGGPLGCRLRADSAVDCSPYDYSPVDGGYQQLAGYCGVRNDGSIGCFADPVGHPAGTFSSVAGGCALRTDQSAVCWGPDLHAPHGTFQQLSTAHSDLCLVTTDGKIVCTGPGASTRGDAPDGTYEEVELQDSGTCARRSDGTITCWGGYTGTLPGTFVELTAAGSQGWCGRHGDGTVQCWSVPFTGLVNVSGTFTKISGACGVTADGRARCWGEGWPYPIPAGTFTQIDVDVTGDWCGILSGGSIVCWNDYGNQTAHAGSFTQLSRECALASDQTITCWAGFDPPPGTFTKISVAETYSPGEAAGCALDTDGHLWWWGSAGYGKISDDVYTDVDAHLGSSPCCGLTPAGTIVCADGRVPPTGTFTKIASTDHLNCGIRTDGSIACTNGQSAAVTVSLSGVYSDLFPSTLSVCGIRSDNQSIVCSGSGDVRAGQFTDVAQSSSFCALHTDGAIECTYPVLPQDGLMVSDGACAVCGNGTLEPSEVCDDGNLVANDGCSPTCYPDCATLPRTDCQAGASGHLVVKSKAGTAKRSLKWSWNDGGPIAESGISDPTWIGRYNLCFYPGGTSLAGSLPVPPQGGWSHATIDEPVQGYEFAEKKGYIGVTSLKIETSSVDSVGISAKGKGAELPENLLSLDANYVVQLVDPGSDRCWSSTFSDGTFDTTKYVAKLP